MSLSQALSVALAGIHVTQQGLSVIAGNVANANTPGYVDETVTPVEVACRRQWRLERRFERHQPQSQRAVAKPAVDRKLRRLLCRYRGADLSAAAADLRHARDRRRRSTRSTIISPARCRRSSTSPSSYSSQAAVVGAAQALTQNLNRMTTGIQQLRTQAEAGISGDVQTANTALQQIANINSALECGAARCRDRDARGPARPGRRAAVAADERARA